MKVEVIKGPMFEEVKRVAQAHFGNLIKDAAMKSYLESKKKAN